MGVENYSSSSLSMLLFSTVSATHSQSRLENTKWKIPRSKHISFKFHAALSRGMKSLTVLLRPTWNMNHHFVRSLQTVQAPHPLVTEEPPRGWSHQIDCPGITVLVFKLPLFYLSIGPETQKNWCWEVRYAKEKGKVFVTYFQKLIVAWHYITMPLWFASLHLITQALYHLMSPREDRRVQCNVIFWEGEERPYSHHFFTVHCYNALYYYCCC